jgi:hypothetical protein
MAGENLNSGETNAQEINTFYPDAHTTGWLRNAAGHTYGTAYHKASHTP